MEVLCNGLVDAVENENDFRAIAGLSHFDQAYIGEKLVEMMEQQKIKKLSPDLLLCLLKHMNETIDDPKIIYIFL